MIRWDILCTAGLARKETITQKLLRLDLSQSLHIKSFATKSKSQSYTRRKSRTRTGFKVSKRVVSKQSPSSQLEPPVEKNPIEDFPPPSHIDSDVNQSLHFEEDSALSKNKLGDTSKTQHYAHYIWVPPAYRGVSTESRYEMNRNGKDTMNFSELKSGRVRKGHATSNRNIQPNNKRDVKISLLRLSDQEEDVKRAKERNIEVAVSCLLQAATSYRKFFHDDEPKSDDSSRLVPSKHETQDLISHSLRSIHSGRSMEPSQVIDSEPAFRAICRYLQQICSLACTLVSHLSKYNDNNAVIYIDLAEFALLELLQLYQDRSQLSSSQDLEVSSLDYSAKAQSAVSGWFNKLVEGIIPDFMPTKPTVTNDQPKEKDLESKINVDDDTSTIQSMKRLLKNVISCIALTTQQPVGVCKREPTCQDNLNDDVVDHLILEKAGKRMVDLLKRFSSAFSVDSETVHLVMEMLCRTGTRESARLCHEMYQQNVKVRVSFALVLEAYHEVVKRENDRESRAEIVEEMMNILIGQWNCSWPTHRVERILQCSIYLNTLAVADTGKAEGMCESGELLAKRALSWVGFTQLLQAIDSDDPTVDNKTLPIADALAKLYSTSSQTILRDKAKKFLGYMMLDNTELSIYPTRDTCNAVLQSIVESTKDKDTQVDQCDFDFANSVLDCMLRKNGSICSPNALTYDLVFTLLEKLSSKDIGIVANETLLKIETCNMLNGDNTFSLSLNMYHRVLKCWLQMANEINLPIKDGRHIVPCRKAMQLIRKLEARSSPMIMSDFTVGTAAVRNLYNLKLRPTRTTYELVIQICANTAYVDDQDEAADIAAEIYQSMVQRDMYNSKRVEVLVENGSNAKVTEKMLELTQRINEEIEHRRYLVNSVY